MHVSRTNAVPTPPPFQPITITLTTAAVAMALKRLCTDSAKEGVLGRSNMAVSDRDIHNVADGIYNNLKEFGVSYLIPKRQRS